MPWLGGLNVPENSDKPKMKLSELTDLYDIEYDSKDIQHTPEKGKTDYDIEIEEIDAIMEEEF